jgi:hypothetical protein
MAHFAGPILDRVDLFLATNGNAKEVYVVAYAHMVWRLGADQTTSTQLERVGRQMFGPQWGGVHAHDTLPTTTCTGHHGMIVNTDASTSQGVHWIVVLDEDGTWAMSDPLGGVGVGQRSALDEIEQPMWSEDDMEQGRVESTCGPKSLATIVVGLAHGLDAFLEV